MKWLDSINIVLLVTLMWRIFQPMPHFVPLLAKEDPPRFLHHPQAASKSLVQQMTQVGTFVNVEDLIRYLHEHPEIELNPEAKMQLMTLQKLSLELLQIEDAILQNEQQLNELTLQLYQSLPPQEQRALLEFRNQDSVQKIEMQYWLELLERPQ